MRYPPHLKLRAITLALDDLYPAYTDRIRIGTALNWLKPLRDVVDEIKTGEVDSLQGYAVTRVSISDSYERIDYCINGFVSLTNRLLPNVDTGPMERIGKRLAAGTLVEEADIQAWETLNMEIAVRVTGLKRSVVEDAAMIEKILAIYSNT